MTPTIELINCYYRAFNEKRFSDMVAMTTEDLAHDTNQAAAPLATPPSPHSWPT